MKITILGHRHGEAKVCATDLHTETGAELDAAVLKKLRRDVRHGMWNRSTEWSSTESANELVARWVRE